MPTIEEDFRALSSHISAHHNDRPGCLGCSESEAALTRIRAALADSEHLEEGARVLLASHELGLVRNTAYGAALDRWLEAERLRQSGKP